MAVRIARKKTPPKPAPKVEEAAPEIRRPSLGRQLWPAIIFVIILLCMVVAFYNPNASSDNKKSSSSHVLQSTKDRYAVTKARFAAMRTSQETDQDAFLSVAKDFYAIYGADKKWANRPAALLRSAMALENAAALAKKNHDLNDARKLYGIAITRYKELAATFKHSVLADDALLQASNILTHEMKKPQEALRLLHMSMKLYPKGDMYKKSQALLQKIQGSKPKIASTPKPVQKADPPKAEAKQEAKAKENPPSVPVYATEKQSLVEHLKALANPAPKNSPPKASVPKTVIAQQNNTAIKEAQKAPQVQVVAKAKLPKSYAMSLPKAAAPKPVPAKAAAPKRAIAIAPTPKNPSSAELSQRMRHAKLDNMAAQLGLNLRTVFIDIGHGGKDQGTAHNDLIERDVVLDIGKRVGSILQSKGFNVVYSRTSDTFIPLSVRSQKANTSNADIFLSIHMNAFPDGSIQGFETYYLDFAKSRRASQVAMRENALSDRKLGDLQNVLTNMLLNVRTKESTGLATSIQKSTISYVRGQGFNTKDGGTRSAPFHVLIGTSMPAVLVEVGYCTHKNEANMLKETHYRQSIDEGISRGIVRYKTQIEKKGTTFAKAF